MQQPHYNKDLDVRLWPDLVRQATATVGEVRRATGVGSNA